MQQWWGSRGGGTGSTGSSARRRREGLTGGRMELSWRLIGPPAIKTPGTDIYMVLPARLSPAIRLYVQCTLYIFN